MNPFFDHRQPTVSHHGQQPTAACRPHDAPTDQRLLAMMQSPQRFDAAGWLGRMVHPRPQKACGLFVPPQRRPARRRRRRRPRAGGLCNWLSPHQRGHV